MTLFLGVDVGTKAVKPTVLKEDGTIVETSNVPNYHLVERAGASWAQRSATQIWEHVKKALSRLQSLAKFEPYVQMVRAEPQCRQIPVGTPPYEFLMYSDERVVKEAEELRRKSARARESGVNTILS